jgi:VIT1/CCC1 family predicted Fe2+/Mn2+ transporter
MREEKTKQKGNLKNDPFKDAGNMHNTLLEALRHREQEILRYIAILAPALGGFIWLLKGFLEDPNEDLVFTVGTLGVLFLLFVGAMYSLVLGYNYRYITLQLAKMEAEFCLNIKEFILESWPRTAKEWAEKYKKKWCAPPEIIYVFWLSFIIAKIFVVLMAVIFLISKQKNTTWMQILAMVAIGIVCVILTSCSAPSHYGKKLYKMCEEEKKANKW